MHAVAGGNFRRERRFFRIGHFLLAVDIIRFFFGDRDVYAAQAVDNRREHIEADKHIVVNIHMEIIFNRIDKQLCAAVALRGVKLVRPVIGDFHIQIAQKRGQLNLFVFRVNRHKHHRVGAGLFGVFALARVHADEQNIAHVVGMQKFRRGNIAVGRKRAVIHRV